MGLRSAMALGLKALQFRASGLGNFGQVWSLKCIPKVIMRSS